jgi:hypothetical protein
MVPTLVFIGEIGGYMFWNIVTTSFSSGDESFGFVKPFSTSNGGFKNIGDDALMDFGCLCIRAISLHKEYSKILKLMVGPLGMLDILKCVEPVFSF